jgi:histidinol-phosphatase
MGLDITDELMGAAVEIVTMAGRLAAQRFNEGSPVRVKADGSQVTAADVEVEELIRALIAARFPGDGVVGEELGETVGVSGRRWVIDPIDGTTYFAQRIPTFEVLLAVEDEDGSAAGVIGYPMSQEVYYAGRGLGCWHQVASDAPQRIAVSDTRQRRGAWVTMSNPAAWSAEFLARLHSEVMLTSNMKGTAGVASGLTDAMIMAGYPMGYHDMAPMPVLLTEAGGRVTDLDGNDVLAGNGTVLASNGHLHDGLLELVRGVPDGRDFRALMRPMTSVSHKKEIVADPRRQGRG